MIGLNWNRPLMKACGEGELVIAVLNWLRDVSGDQYLATVTYNVGEGLGIVTLNLELLKICWSWMLRLMDYIMEIYDIIDLMFNACKYDERIKYELFWMKLELNRWVKNLRSLWIWNCSFINEWLVLLRM